MKIKATKVLTNELNKNKTKQFKDYQINLIKLSEQQFNRLVDSNYGYYEHSVDYDYKTSKFNVIEVCYPYNYYACNTYLTTKDLHNIYKQSDKTYNGFIKAFFDAVEV